MFQNEENDLLLGRKCISLRFDPNGEWKHKMQITEVVSLKGLRGPVV